MNYYTSGNYDLPTPTYIFKCNAHLDNSKVEFLICICLYISRFQERIDDTGTHVQYLLHISPQAFPMTINAI